jgi:methylase of polypeptide subunit release factors
MRGKRRAGAAAEAESALGRRGEAGRGLRVVDTFAGVGAALAALLKAGFHVARYVYADTCAKARKAARRHLKRLSRKYP